MLKKRQDFGGGGQLKVVLYSYQGGQLIVFSSTYIQTGQNQMYQIYPEYSATSV